MLKRIAGFHLLVLVAYASTYRVLMHFGTGEAGILWALLMAIAVAVHTLTLFVNGLFRSDPAEKRTYLLTSLLVALIGFGSCVLHL